MASVLKLARKWLTAGCEATLASQVSCTVTVEMRVLGFPKDTNTNTDSDTDTDTCIIYTHIPHSFRILRKITCFHHPMYMFWCGRCRILYLT
mmetsp:Transcript_2770/g.4440  ORF Transcript_2770/g.4440 Transcript_2770/m.4440 type:complete len:92 (-) Transcript_2770:19-294(-)